MQVHGSCEAALTAGTRIGWVKFKEYRELLNSKWFSLKTKGMVYGDAGIEGNSGSDGKGEWNKMIKACFEKSIGI